MVRGKIHYEEHWQEENRALIIISTETLVNMINDRSLETWAVQCRDSLGGKHVTLMIYNYNDYFKSEKNAQQRVKTAR